MISSTIRRKIMAIAAVLIILMTITAIISMALVAQAGKDISEVSGTYIPAYSNLARASVHSLERALATRRMVIERMRTDSSDARFDALVRRLEEKGAEFDAEIATAIRLINELLRNGTDQANAVALARLDARIEAATTSARTRLDDENRRLPAVLDTRDPEIIDATLVRIDGLRDELNSKLDAIRSDMFAQLMDNTSEVLRNQHSVILISAVLTVLTAILGVVFSLMISNRMTQPVRRLLEGANAVAAGRLDVKLVVQSSDEIGSLTDTFNRMIDQLREKERLRETFGRYVDPRVVEGLMNRPDLANEGQRRVMTILFCDIKGFTEVSERMTPSGLVKVMNRYFSVMSEAIRHNGGVVDKYIGDAVMAYWGPPFVADGEQAKCAISAALDMHGRVASLRSEFPELLGLRELPVAFDIRIGIATGDVLVGSIGSDVMMNYTVLGDTVNFASRLEGVNKVYGSHVLVSDATLKGVPDTFDTREIDRIVVLGQSKVQPVFEVFGPKGTLSQSQTEMCDHYAKGLAAYRAQQWKEARLAFAAALKAMPGDGPAATLMARMTQLEASPPNANWDGAWHLDQK